MAFSKKVIEEDSTINKPKPNRCNGSNGLFSANLLVTAMCSHSNNGIILLKLAI